VARTTGAYALVVLDREEPGRLVALRIGNAGGIVIGRGAGEHFVASDLAALLPHTREMAFLEPGELADLRPGGAAFSDLAGRAVVRAFEPQALDPVAAVRGRYRHFMLKEIWEQPDGLLDALRGRYLLGPARVELEGVPFDAEQVRRFTRVVLIGMGTSWHAAMVGRYYIERLARIPAEVDNAAEFGYRRPILDERTLVISVSQSGETVDLLAAMEVARRAGCAQLTICNTPGAQTTRVADGTIHMRMGPEIAVASTKCFSGAMAALHALALQLGRLRGTLDAADAEAQVAGALHLPAAVGEALQLAPAIEALAPRYAPFEHALFLGRGLSYPLALEGALKLKEVSYLHAEGYAAGEMKHGPIALIDERTPTVALAPSDELRDKMRSNVQQIKARRGRVLALVSAGDASLSAIADDVITLPRTEPLLVPFVAAVVMQLLAYYIAVERGCDVDQPRNLAKTVTVE
jgi:glucosamine--fructose-6-phosphate aminotransferase (isomerizing)